MSFQARVQSVERWVLRQDIQISVQIREGQATYNRSQPRSSSRHSGCAARKVSTSSFLHAPRIHVLSRHDRIDRQERLAFGFPAWWQSVLEQAIQEGSGFVLLGRSAALVELKQIAIGQSALFVSLIFVDALERFSLLPAVFATALRSPALNCERSGASLIV